MNTEDQNTPALCFYLCPAFTLPPFLLLYFFLHTFPLLPGLGMRACVFAMAEEQIA